MTIIWAKALVDHVDRSLCPQTALPPVGMGLTYEEAGRILRVFKEKVVSIRKELSPEEQNRYEGLSSAQIASTPVLMNELLRLEDEKKLVQLLHTFLPPEFANAPLQQKIASLSALTLLSLFNKQLTSLPKSIGNLTALRFLDLSGNPKIANDTLSLNMLKQLRERGCKVVCDEVVEEALERLSEPTGELPAKKRER